MAINPRTRVRTLPASHSYIDVMDTPRARTFRPPAGDGSSTSGATVRERAVGRRPAGGLGAVFSSTFSFPRGSDSGQVPAQRTGCRRTPHGATVHCVRAHRIGPTNGGISHAPRRIRYGLPTSRNADLRRMLKQRRWGRNRLGHVRWLPPRRRCWKRSGHPRSPKRPESLLLVDAFCNGIG